MPVIQSVHALSIIPLLPCNDWGWSGVGWYDKTKNNMCSTLSNSFKISNSLTGIFFGYCFPTLEIFYPQCLYTIGYLSSIYPFLIRIKFCYYFLLILCIANSASLVASKFTGMEVLLRKISPSKFVFTKGLNPKLRPLGLKIT